MEISVVVPTYNRAASIRECIEALLAQDFEKDYEILIIDDGSTICYEIPFTLKNNKVKYIRIEHKGTASAKNCGIKIARGKYIIFIGDDIICTKSFIKSHYDFLLQNKDCASTGLTVWHSSTPNLEYCKILQFIGLGNFSTDNEEDSGFYSFTTSNIALLKSYFEMEQFDENFPYPAMEDNELGLRLYNYGLKIKYNRNAIAYHKHSYNKEILMSRQWQLGYSIGYFIKKHPDMRNKYVKSRLCYLLCFIFAMKVFHLFKFYNIVAACACEKYKGIKSFQKNAITC